MWRTKTAGACSRILTIQRNLAAPSCRVPAPSFHSNSGFLGLCFTSAYNPAHDQAIANFGGGARNIGMGEKAKQTVKNAMEAARDATQKIKDRVVGKGVAVSEAQNGSGTQPTDSSCEDLRNRPGGYS